MDLGEEGGREAGGGHEKWRALHAGLLNDSGEKWFTNHWFR